MFHAPHIIPHSCVRVSAAILKPPSRLHCGAVVCLALRLLVPVAFLAEVALQLPPDRRWMAFHPLRNVLFRTSLFTQRLNYDTLFFCQAVALRSPARGLLSFLCGHWRFLAFLCLQESIQPTPDFFPPPDVARSAGQPLKAKPRNIALETRTRAHLSMVSITSSVSAPPPASAIAASRRTISSSPNSGKSCLFLCERRPPFCRTNKIN